MCACLMFYVPVCVCMHVCGSVFVCVLGVCLCVECMLALFSDVMHHLTHSLSELVPCDA